MFGELFPWMHPVAVVAADVQIALVPVLPCSGCSGCMEHVRELVPNSCTGKCNTACTAEAQAEIIAHLGENIALAT